MTLTALLEEVYFQGNYCGDCPNAGVVFENGLERIACHVLDKGKDPLECPGVELERTK